MDPSGGKPRGASILLLSSFLASVACGCRGGPRQDSGSLATDVTRQPHKRDETLILYLGNESSERPAIDVEIAIDGFLVTRETLDDRDVMAPGEHTLTAVSEAGKVTETKRFAISGKHWAALLYFYSTQTNGAGPVAPTFDFRIQESPILFK